VRPREEFVNKVPVATVPSEPARPERIGYWGKRTGTVSGLAIATPNEQRPADRTDATEGDSTAAKPEGNGGPDRLASSPFPPAVQPLIETGCAIGSGSLEAHILLDVLPDENVAAVTAHSVDSADAPVTMARPDTGGVEEEPRGAHVMKGGILSDEPWGAHVTKGDPFLAVERRALHARKGEAFTDRCRAADPVTVKAISATEVRSSTHETASLLSAVSSSATANEVAARDKEPPINAEDHSTEGQTDVPERHRRRPPLVSAPDATGTLAGSHGGRSSQARQYVVALTRRIRSDSLLRNSLFIMMTTVVNSAFGFVFWLVAARLLTAQVVGLTAAIVSASTIVIILASAGVGGMLIQTLPGQGEAAKWSLTFWAGTVTAVVLSLMLWSFALVVLPLASGHLAELRGAAFATIFAIGTLAMTMGSVFDSTFIAERSAGNMLSRNAVVAAAKVLMLVLFTLVAGASAFDLLGAWALASVLGLAFGVGLLVRRVSVQRPPRPSVLIRAVVDLRSRLAGNQLIGIGGALLPYLLPLLVTARLSSTENAYFYTTWMMGGIFLIIAPAASLALFAEGVHNPNELRAKARSALTLIGALLVPCVVVVFAVGGRLLSIFGTAYSEHATGLLRIVLVASFADAITQVYIAVMRSQGRLMTAAGLNLAMGFGIVVLSWILLPVIGINAVGWAFLSMQLCGCVFVVADIRWRPLLNSVEIRHLQEETM
jgi:O-antigen/teichoic acid export membrane protein